jgi:hypothetical protein
MAKEHNVEVRAAVERGARGRVRLGLTQVLVIPPPIIKLPVQLNFREFAN